MEAARKTFEIENNVTLVDPQRDGIYAYDKEEQAALLKESPWTKDPNYFKKVRISAVALLKMVMHARSGGSIEVMGLMQGKIAHGTFIIMDSYPLPVEGTETRVNAQESAYPYMADYDAAKVALGRPENVIGWYHSHPGYGCWLSGIDVNTQLDWQNYLEPFLAVVIDPNRTISAGKVEIGAFRTYPPGYKPKDAHDNEYQTIPLSKIEDFGAHSSHYYALDIEHFKSSLDTALLDALWNKYWVSTLAMAPLFANREYSSQQMMDLAQKIKKTEHSINVRAGERMMAAGLGMPSIGSRKEALAYAIGGGGAPAGGAGGAGAGVGGGGPGGGAGRDTQLEQIVKDSTKIAGEEITGLLANVVKDRLFNGVVGATTRGASS